MTRVDVPCMTGGHDVPLDLPDGWPCGSGDWVALIAGDGSGNAKCPTCGAGIRIVSAATLRSELEDTKEVPCSETPSS